MKTAKTKIKVLIVDDEASIRRSLIRFLILKGFTVEEAKNGVEALAMVSQYKPDIIILDGRMPEMDGLEACRRLKANSETKNIPVLFSTGTHAREAQLGTIPIDDYILKPYSLDAMYEKITKMLEKK